MDTLNTDVVIEKALGDTRVIWTPNKEWGHFAYLVGGTMYRRARPRETPHMNLATRDGVIRLRRMTEWERGTLRTPVIRKTAKKKKVKRKLASLS